MSFFSTADRVSASLFGTASHLRRKRIFHPRGKAYYGTLRLTAPLHTLPVCQLFTHAEPLPLIVRISRGVGLPSPLPDILGVGLRITNVYGAERHQDFLFCSSGKNFLARRLLIPALKYYNRPYCTILSYRIAGKTWLLSLLPQEPRFQLAIATPLGPWQVVGEITLGAELSALQTKALRFNPWNTGADIELPGFVQRLRKNSYRASQTARAKFE